MSASLPPIRRSVSVALSCSAAFDLFLRRLPEWWPLAARSVHLHEAASCHVELHVGGRLYERARSGEEATWGRFRVLEEPLRAVFSWHPGQPETSSTEVEVRFEHAGVMTHVHLEHRHWERLGERASFVRGLFEGGWGPVLSRFEALARDADRLPEVQGPGCAHAKE